MQAARGNEHINGAQLPPPHQPVLHTLCLLCKLNMCSGSKGAPLARCAHSAHAVQLFVRLAVLETHIL